MEFVSPEGLRQDGRRPSEIRQLKCELGVLPSADGSATFEMGNTKVLAAVYGPRTGARPSGGGRGSLRCEVAIAAFCTSGDRRRGGRDRRAQELAAAVQAVFERCVLLELLPRSEVEVLLQVLGADGGEKAACINAAMLAIANAGIPVLDLLAACNVGYLESTPLLDLNLLEVQGQGPQTTLALFPNLDKVASLECAGGLLRPEALEEVCLLAQEGSKAVAAFMRACLLQHTARAAACQGVSQL